MNFTSVILGLGGIGVALGLLMKYNSKVKESLGLNNPNADKKYINYKINFLLVIGSAIIIFETVSIVIPGLAHLMDLMVSGFLLISIIVDSITKQKIRKKKDNNF